MMTDHAYTGLLAGLALVAALPAWSSAQQPGRTATVVADSQYAAGEVKEFLLGTNRRALWTTPVTVPVLDIGTYAGGLEPYEMGGRQSRTLHFRNPEGRRYIFRSAAKFLHREALPPDLRYTFIGDLIQDQTSTMVPAAGLIMAPLQDAIGVLHSPSELVVMPDDPRLGEWREIFAGQLGQIEENPDELPDDEPGFAGSTKVVKTSTLLDRLDDSNENRIHARDYLALRLVDFLVNDTDRGGDQWKFASFDDDQDGEIWRPVPRDQDWALLRSTGVMSRILDLVYPKLASFDDEFPPLSTLVFMTRDMDRRFLVGLERPVWDSIVGAVQSSLTDDVLAESLGRLPPEYQPHIFPDAMEALRARRDALPRVAAEYYEMVAREADVIASEEDERAEIEVLADGSVTVRLFAIEDEDDEIAANGQSTEPFFTRRFVPGETREVRVFMLPGDDRATVRGGATSIRIRVVGGDGDDSFVDASTAAGPVFHAASEGDSIETGPSTEVDRRPFDHAPPGRPEDLYGYADGVEPGDDEEVDIAQKLSGERYRDWGDEAGFSLDATHRSGVGVLAGGSYSITRYGFRHVPHVYRLDMTALYGLERGTFGLELTGDYRFENSPVGLRVDAHATQFETFRFFGYGNDSPGGAESTRVNRNELALRPSIFWERDDARLAIGPVLRYGESDYAPGSPFDIAQPLGAGSFGQAGAWMRAEWELGPVTADRPHGATITAGASAYPEIWDVADAFGSVDGELQAYLPMPGPGRPFLAVRAGGQGVWGTFPAHEAAFIGGRHSVRGYQTDRYVGDASAYGTTELHVSLVRTELLVRGDLGVFGLADAGRVWLDGESPGGWHTAYGGGLRFASLGSAASVAWARGERDRLYLRLGLPF